MCSKFTGEYLCQSMISLKLLRNFAEIAIRYRCSPGNLLHIFRTFFYKDTYGGLLLNKAIIKMFQVLCVCVCVCVCVFVCVFIYSSTMNASSVCKMSKTYLRSTDQQSCVANVILGASAKFLHLRFKINHILPPKKKLKVAENWRENEIIYSSTLKDGIN